MKRVDVNMDAFSLAKFAKDAKREGKKGKRLMNLKNNVLSCPRL